MLSATLLLIISTVFTFSVVYSRPQRQTNQFEDWPSYVELFLNETAGIDRVLEPADYHIDFYTDGECADASKEIRVVTDNGTEIPSQVYNITTYDASGNAKSCNIAFQVNLTAYSAANYTIYYGNPNAEAPDYSSSSDLSSQTTEGSITVENTYYKVEFIKEGSWTDMPQWMTGVYYKQYTDPDANFVKDTWKRFCMTIAEVKKYWFVPWQPQPGTVTTITEEGSVFVEVQGSFAEWGKSGIKTSNVTYRFYSRIPWFIYDNNLNTSADYGHLEASCFVEPTLMTRAYYEGTDGTVKNASLTGSGQQDFTNWNGTWVDAENADGSIGIGIINITGSTPAWAGLRMGDGEVAPFVNGSVLSARFRLAIYFHEGDYTVVEPMSKALSKMLLPPGEKAPPPIIYLFASVIDIVSGAASPGVRVYLKFENGSLFQDIITNDVGTAIFSDVPPGSYIVECGNVTKNVVVVSTTGVTLRVAVPRPEFWIYIGVGIGACAVIFAVAMVIKRRR